MAIIIFDLDGTVIDTSHRYRNGPDGHIDLDFWFANSTPEMIAKDKLLPLADVWRQFHSEGHTIVVCTARSWERHEKMTCNPGPIYEAFLADNNLPYHALLYRNLAGPDHETFGDGELKTRLLDDYAKQNGFASIKHMGAIMFDDNVKVIQEMLAQRIICLDAVSYNRNLEKGKGLSYKRIFDRLNRRAA